VFERKTVMTETDSSSHMPEGTAISPSIDGALYLSICIVWVEHGARPMAEADIAHALGFSREQWDTVRDDMMPLFVIDAEGRWSPARATPNERDIP